MHFAGKIIGAVVKGLKFCDKNFIGIFLSFKYKLKLPSMVRYAFCAIGLLTWNYFINN